MNPLLTWIFNLSILFLADYYRGFKGGFSSLGLGFLVSFLAGKIYI